MTRQDVFAWSVLLFFVGVLGMMARTTNWLGVPPTLPTDMAAVSIPFQEVAHGRTSGVTKQVNYYLTSEDEWRQLWKLIGEKQPLPKVNFATSDVIAVFAGAAPSSATISVAQIQDSDTRTVHIRVPSSCPSSTSSKRLTPYQIILVPKSALPLRHQNSVVTVSCS